MSEQRQTKERCDRCRCKIENHATAILDERFRMFICPTTDGHAAGDA